MKKIFIFVFLCFFCQQIFSQILLDSAALYFAEEYTSIAEALKSDRRVYKLNLRKKKLTKLPPEITQLEYLQEIDLSKNKFTEFPIELTQLKYLQRLNLSQNKISKIPSEIGNLKNLKALVLNRNEITALPKEIGKLTNLIFLDLWGNPLSTIPDEIGKLTNLKYLDLRVIVFNDDEQRHIHSLLPNTKIAFSNSCNCNKP